MEVEDCSLWHHLIFCEEFENNDEKYVICWLCEELVSSPAYKCLECKFLQQKSCTESLYTEQAEVEHIALGERHHLRFVEELDNGGEEVVCSGCKAPGFGPTYNCSFPKCPFLLHKSCTELYHVIQHPVHPEHILILQRPSYWGKCCYACDNNFSESLFYRCYPCSFYIDIKCVSCWRTSVDDCLQHTIFPIRNQMQFTCETCGEESKGIAYLCSICRVLIHRGCANLYPHTIKTMTHDHSLTRTYSLRQVEDQNIIFCKICYRKVEYAAYKCRKCGYNAHLNCAKDYEDGDRDQSAITELDVTQMVHLVEGMNLEVDKRAGPREIEHFSHPQHNLILHDEE